MHDWTCHVDIPEINPIFVSSLSLIDDRKQGTYEKDCQEHSDALHQDVLHDGFRTLHLAYSS